MKKTMVLFVFLSACVLARADQAFTDFIADLGLSNNITISADELNSTSNIATINGRTVNITSNNVNGSTFKAGNAYTLFNLQNNANVNFYNINLTNARNSSGKGAALYMLNSQAVFDGTAATYITGNGSANFGAGVFAEKSGLTFNQNTVISNNSTSSYGAGGLHAANEATVIFNKDILVENNSSGAENAGGISVENSFLTVNGNAVFNNNYTVSGSGAAINAFSNSASLPKSIVNFNGNLTMTNNTSAYVAGGVGLSDGTTMNVYGDSYFALNKVTSQSGAAIAMWDSKLNFYGNFLAEENTAQTYGGVLMLMSNNTVNFYQNANFVKNTALAGFGGGIHSSRDNVVNFYGNVLVSENKADTVGGGLSGVGKFTFDNNVTEFVKNSAQNGGGFYVSTSTSGATNTLAHFKGQAVISGNKATIGYGGGFIATTAASANFATDIIFDKAAYITGNEAVTSGAGFYATTAKTTVNFNDNAVISNNTVIGSGGYGGGIYAVNGANINFNSKAYIQNNSALNNEAGGGVFNNFANINFSDYTLISDNTTGGYGGGLALWASNAAGTANFYAHTDIAKNRAGILGGGVEAQDALGVVNFKDTVNISQNNSLADGGGVGVLSGGTVNMDKFAYLSGNTAAQNGGAVAVTNTSAGTGTNGTVNISSGAQFINNSAGQNGGAIYLNGLNAADLAVVNIMQSSASTSTVFSGNTAGGVSNAVYLDSNSVLYFNITGGSVEMYDGISGTANNNKIIIDGTESFNFYGNSTGNLADMDLRGGSLNIKHGAVWESGALNTSSGSLFNISNGQIDTVNVQSLNLDGTFKMNITAQANDLINVAGTANLSGNSELKVFGIFQSSRIGIINALGAVTGTLGSVVLPSTVSYTVDYTDPNWVYLVLTGYATAGLSDYSRTHNQNETAKALDGLSLTATGDMYDLILAMTGYTDSALRTALDDLAGSFIANALHAGVSDKIQPYAQKRLSKYCYGNDCDGKGSRFWFEAQTLRRNYGSDENSIANFRDTSYGANFGYDIKKDNDFIVGIAGRYSNHDLKQGRDKGDMSSIGVGVYAGKWFDKLDLNAVFGVQYQDYSLKRKMVIYAYEPKSDFNAFAYNLDLEAGYKLYEGEKVMFRPFAGVSGALLDYEGFTEKGGGTVNLEVKNGAYLRTDARAGFEFGGDKGKLSWSALVAYRFIINGNRGEFDASFEGTDPKMNIYGAKLGRSSVEAILSGGYSLTEKLGLYAQGGLANGSGYDSYLGRLGLQYTFCGKVKRENPLPPPAPVVVKKKTLSNTGAKSHFAVDSYVLSKDAIEELNTFVAELKDVSFRKIHIEGHTDSTGRAAHNQTLSENRARSVAHFLISQGIDENKITYEGFGADKPVAANDTKEGRALNRRIELEVIQ